MRFGKKPSNKFHAKKTEINGEIFDSKSEAERYKMLLMLEKAGKVHDIKRQVKYELYPPVREPDTVGPRGGVKKGRVVERGIYYIADFVYTDEQGNTKIEDVKGLRKGAAYEVFVIKRKLMRNIYGAVVTEWPGTKKKENR